MTAYQMISYAVYLVFRAPANETVMQELNDFRNDQTYYQRNIRKKQVGNTGFYNYLIQLNLEDWNFLKPKLKYKPKTTVTEYPLYKFGFQNIIEDLFTHEAYNFISEQNGYFSNTSNASFMEQSCTYVLDFGTVTYKTLNGGFDLFCYSLANRVLDPVQGIGRNAGGLWLKHELVNIVKSDGKYTLTFNNLEDSTTVTVRANKIILGMPKRSVEILYNKIALLQAPLTNYQGIVEGGNKNQLAIQPTNLQELISSTQNMPAIKIILNFTKNWWDIGKKEEFRTATQMRGVSVTDLPIRQTLYFGTNADNMILASYNDMITA